MPLPLDLQKAIEEEIGAFPGSSLSQAYEELSGKYREASRRTAMASSGKQFMATPSQRAAYVAARMPATFAVLHRVFRESQERAHLISPISLLDLGSGPGTAMWAACEVFPHLQKVHLFEQDEQLIAIGKRLAKSGEHAAIQGAIWEKGNLVDPHEREPYDLVVLSYVLGEIAEKFYPFLFQQIWKAARHLLVCVEPGTPDGFERIHKIRTMGLENGAHIIAPCPGAGTCPMHGNDWCHFAARVERTNFHRQLKKGTLGHEDEKFSYIVLSKEPVKSSLGRVIRHPGKHTGHVTLQICTQEGLMTETISKRDGPAYKQAKKVEWGDAWTM